MNNITWEKSGYIFVPCRTTKRDRTSNVVKRLGIEGAKEFYQTNIERLKIDISLLEIDKDYIEIKHYRIYRAYNYYHYVLKQNREEASEKALEVEKDYNEWVRINYAIQNAKVKMDRFKRFSKNLEHDK